MSVSNGASIICVICFFFGLVYHLVKIKQIRIALFIATPIISSYLLYWGPDFKNFGNPEYTSWAILIISIFTGAGFIGSFLAFHIRLLRKLLKSICLDIKENKGNLKSHYFNLFIKIIRVINK